MHMRQINVVYHFLFHGMKENEQDYVIEKVLEFKSNVWNCWSVKL